MAEPKYGNYNGLGSRYKTYPDRPSEAWVMDNDRKSWDMINSVDHINDVIELTKDEWEKDYPDAPPLPKEAFRPR
jgi:hypothetical protein